MARVARAEVFAADEVAIVHVMNRTVRRCFLLGDDPVTGRNYDHRKQWIDDQLVHQSRYFGIDLLCQAILSNHFHLILRSRPDVVAEWDDTEVARRWLMLCPLRRDENHKPLDPRDEELNTIRNDKDKLQQVRSRLSDISWWMRLLSQNIAQRANREDEEVGKFWQARYRAVRLLDETAVLACAAYVDLNPIRAAMAQTIETSEYTSAQKRCHDLQAARTGSARAQSATSGTPAERASSQSRRGRHLAPVDLKEQTAPTGPQVHKGGTRCSNKGYLPMTTAEYLEFLRWTTGEMRPGRSSQAPPHIPPLLDRLGVSAAVWLRLVADFGRLFSVVAGQPHRIDDHQPQRRGSSHRYRTRQETRELFSTA
jgi:hypothetical protein